jgi:endonuclease/exonuclease/phosphatase family metal-dependent hydrolase
MATDQREDDASDAGWGRWMAGLALVELLAWPLSACDPLNATFESVEPAETYRARSTSSVPESVERPEIMTWNVKFGGGRIRFFFECPGDRVIMERSEVVRHLEGIAEKIRQVDPDVLLLQEVDIDSKRTAHVDQVQWLLDHTDFNHAAYASQWRSRYIPKHGLGPVDSGNAILSKWPIEQARRIALPLISDQNFVVRYFYLKRNVLKTEIDIPGRGPLHVLNTHLSAFSKDGTRKRQVRKLESMLNSLDRRGEPFVAGGDFNLIPPGSERTADFPDAGDCEDYEPTDYGDKLDTLGGLYDRYEAAIPLDEYKANNEPYFTFTGREDVFWNRKLDYLLTNRDFVDGSGLVHQSAEQGGMETIGLSDHAPVTATLAPNDE